MSATFSDITINITARDKHVCLITQVTRAGKLAKCRLVEHKLKGEDQIINNRHEIQYSSPAVDTNLVKLTMFGYG